MTNTICMARFYRENESKNLFLFYVAVIGELKWM